MSTGRLVGYGLLGGAGLIALLMVAWLLTSGASAGGIVLGALLGVALAGPLAVGGIIVLSRQRQEALDSVDFDRQREIADADRVFRTEVAATLRSLAEGPGAPRAALTQLAAEVGQSPVRGSRGWAGVPLDERQRAVLTRYDDLVWQRVRGLRDARTTAEVEVRLPAIREALDQRDDLLLRGRDAPALPASDLLRSAAEPATASSLAEIDVGWALTREHADFVVEGLASYFADGRTWRLAHLVPTDGAAVPGWLYVGPAASVVAWLVETEPPTNSEATLAVDATGLALLESGTAVVDVRGGAGRASGVLVTYRRYGAGSAVALVEQWPSEAVRAYRGELVGLTELEIWPAAAAS
jgi:hypothetical protein